MGLFDKKYCDFCGGKIGLLGNKKLEDGNMCKDCAAKLSPWFSERRHSTKADIQAQLDYREENRAAVAAFHTTRTLGKYTKLLLDEDNRKFMVTSASNLAAANPDVLDYSQVTGCNLDIHENKHELKTQDKDGKSVSYNPPRYEYSYSFAITIFVNHPYFDDMHFSVSNGSVKTGERSMNTGSSANNINSINMLKNKPAAQDLNEYNEYLALGNEIKAAIDGMREETREQVSAQNAPKTAVTCPWCGATTFPDENGCCEYCGGAVGN